MKNSLLLKLFDSIEVNEWRALEKYLFGNFSEDSELAVLYKYIKKHRKTPQSKKLILENANNFLFKKKTRKNFSNLMSVLTGHIKSYFINLQLNKKELLQNALLIEELNNRNLYNEATNVYLDTEKKESKWKIGLMNNLYKQMIYHQLYFSYNPVKGTKIGAKLMNKNLTASKETKEHLDALHQMEIAFRHFYKRENYINEKGKDVLEYKLPDLINSLEKIQFYQDKEEYEKVIKVFYNDFELWDIELQNLTFHILRNYLVYGIRHGNNRIEELSTFAKFSILDNGFDFKGLYAMNGAIGIYEAAVISKDYQWADFILSKIKKVNPSQIPNNEIKIFEAIYYYSIEDYENALLIVNELSKLERMEKLIIRKWQMMCYAELHPQDFSFLHSQYINYNSFMNRKKSQYSPIELDGGRTFGKIWKLLFLDGNASKALNLLDHNISCPKRYFFMRKITEVTNS